MTTSMVVPLSQAGQYPRETVGGKARDLGWLMSSGFRVPDGFVITTEVWANFAQSDALPDELIDALRVDTPRAFRSSAVSEDSAEASFAGQYESVLDVRGYERAVEALRRCWASAHGAALDEYIASVSHKDGGLAVIVQEMIAADCAGVTFTVNPITGAPEMLIEATLGLGDALMEGSVEPERWAVDGPQPRRLSGPAEVLDHEQVDELRRVCGEIAESRGCPQDIEWAFAGGTLYILQSRPVTALPIEPTERPAPRQSWARDDAHFPEPVMPFPASFWLPAHGRCLGRAAARAGLPLKTIHSEVYGGRVYSRPVPLIDPGNDEGKAPPSWVFWLMMRLVPAFRRRIKAAEVAVTADLPLSLVDAWEGGGRDRAVARTRELVAVDRAALGNAELARHIDEIMEQVEAVGDVHFEFILISGLSTFGALGRLLERHLGWSVAETVDLVQGYGQASAAAGRALESLATVLSADPEAMRLLHDAPAELRALAGPAGDAYRGFLEERGHRLYSAAFHHPTWAEDPTPLVALLRAGIDQIVERPDPRSFAREAEARARQCITDESVWREIETALGRARRARPYQDETEDSVFDAFGVLRYAVLEAGKRFTRLGVLDAAESVWFLKVDEVLELLRGGTPVFDVARRRGEHRWAQGNRLPAVLGPDPEPPPNFTFPPKVDDFLGGVFWALLADGQQNPEAHPDADFSGLGCSPGEARGRVRVIINAESLHALEAGEILVCPGTTAAWSVAFPLVAGIITETGGPLSHPATLAREYGLPAVLCVKDAVTALKDGDVVRIDGTTGAVWRE